MDRNAIRIVIGRELRDTLRDRRTLFLMLGLPLVLYPMLMIGVSQMIVVQYANIVEDPPPVVIVAAPEGFAGYVARHAVDGLAVQVVEGVDDPATALEDGDIEAYLEFTTDAGDFPLARCRYTTGRDRSRAANTRLISLLQRFRKERVDANLAGRDLDRSFVVPFKIQPDDIASEEKKGGTLFGQSVSILLVLMAVTFPFYPAIDAAAGEKERGTLETILVSPIGRRELVLGKFVAIFVVALVGSMLNLGALLLTFGHFAQLVNQASEKQWSLRGLDEEADQVEVEGIVEKRTKVEFHVTAPTAVAMLCVLVPLCGLFSSLSLALSSMARTYKEGQYYLTPMMALVLPLVLVAMIPEIHLTYLMAMLPVSNVCLLFRELLAGNARPGQIVLVLASTLVYAGMALFWTQSLFNREEILFRQPGSLSWRFWRGSAEYEGRPRPRHAISLFVTSVLLLWFIGQTLQSIDLVTGLVVSLVLLVLTPAVYAARLYRWNLVEVFSLRRPSIAAVAGGILLGAGGLVLGLEVVHYQALVLGQPPPMAIEGLDEMPILGAILLIAILPAVCEEFLCRGLILKGLLADSSPFVAICGSAMLFAFLHLNIYRLAFTFVLGVLLGYAVIRSRSLWAGSVLHATSNAAAVLLGTSDRLGDLVQDDGSVRLPWLLGAFVAVGVGAWLVGVRPAPPPAAGA